MKLTRWILYLEDCLLIISTLAMLSSSPFSHDLQIDCSPST